MRPNCGHISLAFLIKFLNFLQAFVGIAMILYSVWMLDQWNNHVPVSPSPESSSLSLFSDAEKRLSDSDRTGSLTLADLVSGFDGGLWLDLSSIELPAPWFIYSFMGVGILLCAITFIGCIAAEALNGCCLCFYTLLKTVLIVLEAALVAFIAIDRRWEKDLPFDPTGELQSLRSFVEKNVEICEWIGVTVVSIQALSLLLAIFLRAMVSTRKDDDDDEIRGRSRDPQSSQASGSNKGDVRGLNLDIWSSRLRNKYGLNSGNQYSPLNQNVSRSINSRQ